MKEYFSRYWISGRLREIPVKVFMGKHTMPLDKTNNKTDGLVKVNTISRKNEK